ncbi:hypothetical protein [Clostridium nigeriense]|mgnify:CR=1 FL=1|uniref:hypothetical protein n=1 Tax=Clostridium nigeriense TaxID=1805470 RepID=UPI000836D6DF|nr:hypothetical protein [Clostridium nigeriense]
MENKLEQLINENEKFYEERKNKLNKRLGVANEEYQSLLKDFNRQVDYINKSTEYSPEGKINKNKEILDRFIDKVNYAALNHYADLNNEMAIILKEYEIKTLEKINGLNPKIMPQLMYVNTMISNITSINDADILESVFNYICLDSNFSDEMVNIVYLKARNILNNDIPNVDAGQEKTNKVIDVVEASKRGKNRTKIQDIVSKIEKYKTDYTNEFQKISNTFKSGALRRQYPGSLYLNKDIKNDFTLISSRINDPWKM